MTVKHKLALTFYTERCILCQRVKIAEAIFKLQSLWSASYEKTPKYLTSCSQSYQLKETAKARVTSSNTFQGSNNCVFRGGLQNINSAKFYVLLTV